jgi:hypothetical protein
LGHPDVLPLPFAKYFSLRANGLFHQHDCSKILQEILDAFVSFPRLARPLPQTSWRGHRRLGRHEADQPKAPLRLWTVRSPAINGACVCESLRGQLPPMQFSRGWVKQREASTASDDYICNVIDVLLIRSSYFFIPKNQTWPGWLVSQCSEVDNTNGINKNSAAASC